MKVELLKTNAVNIEILQKEVLEFRALYPEQTQFCITSEHGDDNLFEGAGFYPDNALELTKVNKSFKGSYIESLVDDYPEYFRWRIMCIKPKTTYSVHRDSIEGGNKNQRIHFPVHTNPESYLVFYEKPLTPQGNQNIEYYHLQEGNIYLVDTTGYHTAVNYDHKQERIHIIAERFIPHE